MFTLSNSPKNESVFKASTAFTAAGLCIACAATGAILLSVTALIIGTVAGVAFILGLRR
jgi:hypothetical protein